MSLSTRDASLLGRAGFAVALAATLLVTACASPSTTPRASTWAAPTAAPSGTSIPLPGAESALLIARAIEAVKADPTNVPALLSLGLACYQHARETADPTDYARADEAFDRILTIDPKAAEAIIGKGIIALARHDFAGGLAYGERCPAGACRHGRPGCCPRRPRSSCSRPVS